MTTVRPLLMSGEMVRALLDGRKSQTRRVLKPQPSAEHYLHLSVLKDGAAIFRNEHTGYRQDIPMPYAPGDLLWVRETWARWPSDDSEPTFYKADADNEREGWMDPPGIKYRPSIHMPRWASRLTLRVTEVRVERVQDISEEDALAEGVMRLERRSLMTGEPLYGLHDGYGYDKARNCFLDLWNHLNLKRGYGSSENPWVVVIVFEPIQANVDDVLRSEQAELVRFGNDSDRTAPAPHPLRLRPAIGLWRRTITLMEAAILSSSARSTTPMSRRVRRWAMADKTKRWPDPIHARFLELRRKGHSNSWARHLARQEVQKERQEAKQ